MFSKSIHNFLNYPAKSADGYCTALTHNVAR